VDAEDLVRLLVGGVSRVAQFVWWWGPAPSKRPQPRSQVYLTLYRLGLTGVMVGAAGFCWSVL
jgi:hypothetical protein